MRNELLILLSGTPKGEQLEENVALRKTVQVWQTAGEWEDFMLNLRNKHEIKVKMEGETAEAMGVMLTMPVTIFSYTQ